MRVFMFCIAQITWDGQHSVSAYVYICISCVNISTRSKANDSAATIENRRYDPSPDNDATMCKF